METRYAIRKRQLLAGCQVAPEAFEQVVPRLYTFMAPFVKIFQGQVADQHAKTYVCGLLSDVKRKNIESIAYWTLAKIDPVRKYSSNPCQGITG